MHCQSSFLKKLLLKLASSFRNSLHNEECQHTLVEFTMSCLIRKKEYFSFLNRLTTSANSGWTLIWVFSTGAFSLSHKASVSSFSAAEACVSFAVVSGVPVTSLTVLFLAWSIRLWSRQIYACSFHFTMMALPELLCLRYFCIYPLIYTCK